MPDQRDETARRFPYRWGIRRVPGETIRRLGWWLTTAPAGKTIKASTRRYRIGKWLLAVTDDRSWTVRHQSKWQLRIRRYLGRREREYELVEDSDA